MLLQPVRLCSFLTALLLLGAAPKLTVTVLSSRPDMVSGNDALIEIKTTGAQKLQVKVNGRDVSQVFHADAARGSMIGLVDGLRAGPNTVIVKAGSATTKLQLVNHPITGPIVSGEHLKPYFCTTEESGLGKPLDTDCSAPTKVAEPVVQPTPAAAPAPARPPAPKPKPPRAPPPLAPAPAGQLPPPQQVR